MRHAVSIAVDSAGFDCIIDDVLLKSDDVSGQDAWDILLIEEPLDSCMVGYQFEGFSKEVVAKVMSSLDNC